ncbi:MAG: T9SS type A sorting domain-containing protein [Saprospiraceae bacterium]|jgi:hypothetical protein|nr:T9SS type A sorting domain-containing protein [Saprospiraceae bacterium]
MNKKSLANQQFATDAISSQIKFDSLDQMDINYLTAIADVEDCKGAVLSQNLLNFFYGANYLRHPLDISENNANIEERKANQGDTAKKENNVYVFPNPIKSGERFTIHANGDVALEIWTLSGQLLKKVNARGIDGCITVESAGMHPGIYLIRTLGSDGHTGVGKIIVK